jgi:hypothetical protein
MRSGRRFLGSCPPQPALPKGQGRSLCLPPEYRCDWISIDATTQELFCTLLPYATANYRNYTVGSSSTTTRVKSASFTEDTGASGSYGTDLIDALDDLLVLFEIPPEAKEDQDVAAVLQRQPVASRLWVDEKNRDLS